MWTGFSGDNPSGFDFAMVYALLAVLLLAMGIFYNARPLRTKDRPYLDVLSEAVNNPLRLLLGWFTLVGSVLPPSSILLAYWMGGAFLMAVKRFTELRGIADREAAGNYRRSFRCCQETISIAIRRAISTASSNPGRCHGTQTILRPNS